MLFDLKDDKVLKIQPIYTDSYYDEGWCETCGGEWVDGEIEINIEFEKHEIYKYVRSAEEGDKQNSICTLIDYLFTNLNEFNNMSTEEFIEKLTLHLDKAYGFIYEETEY